MKFGTIHLDNAVGAILAHGIRHENGSFKKGRLLSAEDVRLLQGLGHETIIAARLEAGDVPEDEAAHKIAVAAKGVGVSSQQAFTGRANLHSAAHGLVVVDHARVHALNRLDESLTIATLGNCSVVRPKQMVATVKVIPFAVRGAVLEQALAIIGASPLVRVAAFMPRKAGLIITKLPQTKPSLIRKSEDAMRERLAALGSELAAVAVCDHRQSDVAALIGAQAGQGLDPILVFGASAIVDRADVIPGAVVEAGGAVTHLGMPVDPGNLMMLGKVSGSTVLGVPSCARSPKVNGFDWVLERAIAGLDVTSADIMAMGVGGLLAEIPSRPSPREPRGVSPSAPRVAAVVLAAGKSSRMGSNKMLMDLRGQPMVRATVDRIARSSVDDVIVVTGNDAGKVEAVLAGTRARIVHNADYADGLSTSLASGVRAAGDVDAVVVCLGDMPLVDGLLIDRLIAAFNPTEGRSIVVPTHNGKFGNPVLWGAEHFGDLLALSGDRGARELIGKFKADAVEIEAGSDAVLRDADTPEAFAAISS